MAENTITFTKEENGYAVDEVDQYLEMLQQSYEQQVEAGRECETQSAKLKGDLDRVNEEKSRLMQELDKARGQLYTAQRYQEEARRLQQQVSAQEEQLQDAKEKLQAAARQASEKDGLEARLQDREAQAREREETLRRVNDELGRAQQKVQELQAKLQKPADDFSEIFETAQSAAMEYVTMKKGQADQMLAETKAHTEEEISGAEKRAAAILENARADADKLLREAEDKRDEMINEAESKVQYSRHKAERLMADAQKAVDGMLEKGKREYANIRSLIQASSEQYAEMCKKIAFNEPAEFHIDSASEALTDLSGTALSEGSEK